MHRRYTFLALRLSLITVAAAGAAVIEINARRFGLEGFAAGAPVGLLIGISCVLSLPLLEGRSWVAFGLTALPYLVSVFDFLVLPAITPEGDSNAFHQPMFDYFVEAFGKDHYLPTWFPFQGGVPAAMFQINFFFTLPARFVGTVLAALIPLPTLFFYKLQFILSVVLLGFGWWLVLLRLTKSRTSAYLGTVTLMMGGTGITSHQEQVMATAHLVPWFVLCLLELRERPAFLLPLLILAGIGTYTHYPQILAISFAAFSAAVITLKPEVLQAWRDLRRRPWFLLVCLVALTTSLAPGLYMLGHADEFGSPERDAATLRVDDYEAYLQLNLQQTSSAPVHSLLEYLVPGNKPDSPMNEMDSSGLFVGRIGLALGLLSLFGGRSSLRLSIVFVVLAGLFAALVVGVNFVLPRFLFWARFPLIDVFRQWYHFMPMLNLCLTVLAALGLGVIRRRAFIGAVIFVQVFDLASFDRAYIQRIVKNEERTLEETLNSQLQFQYRGRMELGRECPTSVPDKPFLTRAVVAVAGGRAAERSRVCHLADAARVVVPGDFPVTFLAGREEHSTSPMIWRHYHNMMIAYLDGQEAALLVTPLNEGLDFRAEVDGSPSQVWRINGALVGVLVGPQTRLVVLRPAQGFFKFSVLLQAILYATVTIVLVVGLRRRGAGEGARLA